MARLRSCLAPEHGVARRVIHRFDGPYTIGDLPGVENPEGLCGERLEMHASFLSASSDRLDNLLKAVRGADVDIEAVALEPISCSLGTLSTDERALGAAVLDFGAGAFRGGLWEGGRLRQLHIVGRDGPTTTPQSSHAFAGPLSPAGGMEGVVLGIARRFRIAPATAERPAAQPRRTGRRGLCVASPVRRSGRGRWPRQRQRADTGISAHAGGASDAGSPVIARRVVWFLGRTCRWRGAHRRRRADPRPAGLGFKTLWRQSVRVALRAGVCPVVCRCPPNSWRQRLLPGRLVDFGR